GAPGAEQVRAVLGRAEPGRERRARRAAAAPAPREVLPDHAALGQVAGADERLDEALAARRVRELTAAADRRGPHARGAVELRELAQPWQAVPRAHPLDEATHRGDLGPCGGCRGLRSGTRARRRELGRSGPL